MWLNIPVRCNTSNELQQKQATDSNLGSRVIHTADFNDAQRLDYPALSETVRISMKTATGSGSTPAIDSSTITPVVNDGFWKG